MRIQSKLAVAVAGAVLSLVAVGAKPASAANFSFNLLNFLGGPNQSNGGSLSFNQSTLTGVGLETAALSDLPDAAFSLNFSSILPLSFSPTVSGFSFSNPIFDFNDGNLVGISGVSSVPVTNTDGRSFPVINVFEGSDQLSLTGAQFEADLIGTVTNFNAVTGQVFSTFDVQGLSARGAILFTTIEPVTSPTPVPEPLTIGSSVVAGGIGLLLKRKKAGKAKA